MERGYGIEMGARGTKVGEGGGEGSEMRRHGRGEREEGEER